MTSVAVEMGPRNRRRLTIGGVGLAAVAAVCVVGVWFFGGLPLVGAKNQAKSTAPASRHLALIPDALVYGMTTQQVLHKIGKPEKVVGKCWQYREGVQNFVGETVNAVRVCFFGNVYSSAYYQEIDGLWRDPSGSRHVIAPPTQ